jgi:hypothetical protein
MGERGPIDAVPGRGERRALSSCHGRWLDCAPAGASPLPCARAALVPHNPRTSPIVPRTLSPP